MLLPLSGLVPTNTMGSLRFPAFLLVLLNITVVQITAVINMGMFPEVPDYSYYNCRDKVLDFVTKPGGLLETERNNNKDFKSTWQGACKKNISGGRKEHMTALHSFVADGTFRQTFNKALTKSRGDDFPFKSLFFLLTDAMNLLKGSCRTVYYGTETEYNAKIGEEVRFKSFFPAQLKYSDATEIAALNDENKGTVLSINSCSVISLKDYVCNHGEYLDLLISPTEVFTVKNITTVSNRDDNYKEITLIHSRFHSSSNCSALASLPKPEGTKETPKPEVTKESSSCFLSSSSLNVVAFLFIVYFCTLTL